MIDRRWRWTTISALLLTLGIVFPSAARAQLTLRLVVSALTQPLAFIQDPSDSTVQFIVQKGGRIRVLKSGVLQPDDFLDLSGVVSVVSEQGLLGLAFAQDYASSRRFYVNFTNAQGHTVIARFKRSVADPLKADASTRFDLRWPDGQRFITQPYANHNGGTLRFGPDGFLYIGMGDGGSGNDPGNRAQTPTTLLGKMLRIDVSVADTDADGYAVPATNPFVDNAPIAAMHEIWDFGLRNPWKFSFDDPARGGTGSLFIGDVGQGSREEVDAEPAATGARNYGWRIREGTLPGGATPVLPAAYLPLTGPIVEYAHTVGTAIIGGYVYRGSQLPSSYLGRYFFGDFGTGLVMSMGLTYSGAGEASSTGVIDHTAELGGGAQTGQIASIDVDANGELYLVDFRGSIRRIESATPLTLSITGSGSVTATPPTVVCTTNCTRWYFPGTAVMLTSAPAAGSVFAGWTGDPDCLDNRVTMSDARTCAAKFLPQLPIRPSPRVDLNNDGRGDVFTYHPVSGKWAIDTTAASGSAGRFEGLWAPGWSIYPGDFNGDGLTDLFLYNKVNGQWFKATRTPAGGFLYFTLTWAPGWDVYVLDLNGDGKADVFLYNPTTGNWQTALNVGAGDFSYTSGTWAAGWQVFPAELDGNSNADLFLYNSSSGAWMRAVNAGAGTWTLTTGLWRHSWTVHIGDFNGDRTSDVFLYDPATGQWFICTNVGTGFTYVTGMWATGWTVRLGDFDGNTRADVFLYNPVSGAWQEAVNTASGFTYAGSLWAPGWEVHVTDLNGDGRADVLLYWPMAGDYFRCLNNGVGFTYARGLWEKNLTIVAAPVLPE